MSDEQCVSHPHVTLVKFCPACRGSVKSPRKREMAIENQRWIKKKRGWPKGRSRKAPAS